MIEITNYSLSNSIISREIDNILMVFNSETGDMLEINDIGKEIFEFLKDGTPFHSIVDMLCIKYIADKAIIEADTMDFIERLIDIGVIILRD